MELERAGPQLAGEPVPLDEADAVLAGDRPAEPERELEQLLGHARRQRELSLVLDVEQEGRVEVAVARVAPGAARQAEPATDLERLLDRLGEPVERHGDVLARLATALRTDDQREAVAPAPQRCDLLRKLGCIQS